MRRRWIKNLWRLLVIATMVGCVLTAPGCIFFGWAGHVVAGGETVTAQYKPQDRLTLVLVDDPSHQLEDPTMAGRIASSIGRELKKNKIITEFVSDVEVARVATRQGEKFAAMPLDQLGRAVGAAQVLHVHVTQYHHRPVGGLWEGSAWLRVKIFDVENRQRLFPMPPATGASDGDRDMPVNAFRRYSYRSDHARAIRQTLSNKFADHISLTVAQVFFTHQPPRDLEVEQIN